MAEYRDKSWTLVEHSHMGENCEVLYSMSKVELKVLSLHAACSPASNNLGGPEDLRLCNSKFFGLLEEVNKNPFWRGRERMKKCIILNLKSFLQTTFQIQFWIQRKPSTDQDKIM